MKFIVAATTIFTAVSAVTISLPSGVSIPSGVTLPSGVTVVSAAASATADSNAKAKVKRQINIPGLQTSSTAAAAGTAKAK
ncbi:hypothetical protein QBC36DRAFT_147791, partial [Triangularia setosa]